MQPAASMLRLVAKVRTTSERGTVLCTLPRALLTHAASRHIDPALLRDAAGIGEDDLVGADARVPRTCVDRLWQLVAEAVDDDALGVHLAESLPPGNAGILEFVVLSSATAGEAWAHSVRYWRLLNDEVDVQLIRGNDFRIRLRPRVGGPFHRHWLEFTVAVIELSARRMISDPSPITEVCFPFERHSSSSAIEALLPCSVRYSHDALEVAAPASFQDHPLVSANALLRDFLIERAEALLAALPADDDVMRRVNAAVDNAMSAGDPSLEIVARSVHMSTRSLQRALRENGTSFRELVDSSRQRIASQMLTRDDTSVSEIAFLLGFSEVSAFHRAFRRWTGLAPTEFRRRAREVAQGRS